MGFLRIYCGSCRQTWDIYSRDDYHDWKAMTCPHCFEQIDPGLWEKQILPAFGAMEDANRELRKEQEQYGGKPFSISYHPGNLAKDDLRDDVNALRIEIDRLIDTVFS